MKYKLLGRSGLRVSQLCLGCMGFGEEWGFGGNKEDSRKVYQKFIDGGGNFIDTANRYTEGTSEKYLGEFIAGMRNEVVLATKYSLYSKRGSINECGNSRKNLIASLEGSLKRLNTDYVDVLYLHAWDFMTPIDEVLRSLDDLVRAGKILYAAISDTPAWIISRANTMADFQGWSPFVAVQLEYSLITRDAERDLIPMTKALDLAVTSWGPLAGGALTGKYLEDDGTPKRLKEGSKRLNDKSVAIAKEVVRVAKEIGCSASQVALAWQYHKSPNIIPIVGAHKETQIADCLGSIDIKLSNEQYNALEEVSKIELGFPHDFLTGDVAKNVLFGGTFDSIENHRKL